MISGDRLEEITGTERRQEPPMDDDEFKAIAAHLIDSARDLMDENIMPAVERAWVYYNGGVDQPPMGFLGEHKETGKPVYEGSGVVLTECRDQVQTLLPEIYRVLAGSEEAVAFKPAGPEDTAYVEQANDYVRHLFWDRNHGENLVKDGLLEWAVKFCAYRVWRENSHREHVNRLEEVDEVQLSALQQDGSVQLEDVEPYEVAIPQAQQTQDGQTVFVPVPMTFYRVTARYFEPVGKTRVQLIPQDEILIDLEAQSLDEATVVGIDCERRASDLIASGLPREDVMEAANKGLRSSMAPDIRRYRSGMENNARRRQHSSSIDESTAWVRVVDARVLVDRDKDGIAEAWRVIGLGSPIKIVDMVEDPGSDEIVIGSPYPRPHEIIGAGIVENTDDLQDIGTSIVRRTLDNLARSINPRPAVAGGNEDTYEALDSWFGGPIPLGPNGRIDWYQVPFEGAASMPMLEFFEQRRVLRTGISPASQGLDPRALKGQTLDAVAGILAGPQSRIEGYAREFAARVMAPLFKAILRITVAYQDRPEVIRLRNKWVPVDPRSWNSDMDVEVEVGLGTGSRLERMIMAQQILTKQEQLAQVQSPLFDIRLYRQALADFTHALGVKDVARYWPEIDDQKLQQIQAQAEQQKQQQIQQAAQIQQAMEEAKAQAKAQAEIAVETVKAQLEGAAKERELTLEGMIDRAKLDLEGLIKAQLLRVEGVIEAHLLRIKGAQMGSAKINANIERRQ